MEEDELKNREFQGGALLGKEDCTCPICMYIMIEPVTMPCKHSLCMRCYKQTVEKSSLTCPICRVRISVWARRASKFNALIDQVKWEAIKRAFPVKVQSMLQGEECSDDEDDVELDTYESRLRKLKELSEPGEIRQEYETALQKLKLQQQEAAKKEEEASAALIRALQEEEESNLRAHRIQMEEVDMIGRLAAEQLQAAEGSIDNHDSGQSSRTSKSRQRHAVKANKRKKRPATRTATSNLTMNLFFSPVHRRTSSSVPPECDLVRKTTEINSSLKNDIRSSLNENSSSPESDEVSFKLSPISPLSASSNTDEVPCLQSRSGVEGCEVSGLTSKSEDISKAGPSGMSVDSFRFQPIKTCERTPPRKLWDGSSEDPPLQRVVPRHGADCVSKSLFTTHDGSSRSMHNTFSCLQSQSKVSIDTRQLLKGRPDSGQRTVVANAQALGQVSRVQDHGNHKSQDFEAHPGIALSTPRATTSKSGDSYNVSVAAADMFSEQSNVECSHFESKVISHPVVRDISSNKVVNSGENLAAVKNQSKSSCSKLLGSGVTNDQLMEISKASVVLNAVRGPKLQTAIKSNCEEPSDSTINLCRTKDDHTSKNSCYPAVHNSLKSLLKHQSKGTERTLDEYVQKKSSCVRNKDDITIRSLKQIQLNKGALTAGKRHLQEEGLEGKGKSVGNYHSKKQECSELDDAVGEQVEADLETLTQEEKDHRMALELQEMFVALDSRKIQVDRFKGSEGEYSFRNKRKRK